MKYRIEKDTLGEVEVPADVYYGPQTQRSVNNFKIATDISRMPKEVIEAFAYLKKERLWLIKTPVSCLRRNAS